ncbi:hypothetical protein BO78DRAFT_38651 [Aspergillus sclerotiicarbonarius CBS 121057]|uniref:C2H2-type domain-containing protein n=1 Tax=Aspergillus sclerotiicarbonarius (strain CBS 121057 / IBT 28362) TaxID=1448318 RepID=A0A319EXG7_ASPSB|nr:hypothetical protein BO78DRAFT_38651 [Aspergillus sclerotiicarbonarius CBS 121057]
MSNPQGYTSNWLGYSQWAVSPSTSQDDPNSSLTAQQPNTTALASTGINLSQPNAVPHTAVPHTAVPHTAAPGTSIAAYSQQAPHPYYVVDVTNNGFVVTDAETPATTRPGGAPPQPITRLRCRRMGCTSTSSFTREADLWRHIRNLHVTPGSYPCLICGRRFNQEYNQRNHMRTRHPIVQYYY